MNGVIPDQEDYDAAKLDLSFAAASDAEKYRLAQAAKLKRLWKKKPRMVESSEDHKALGKDANSMATQVELWGRYLAAMRAQHDVGRRIAGIGVKANPTQAELDSIEGLLAEYDDATRAVADAAQAGRAALTAAATPKASR